MFEKEQSNHTYYDMLDVQKGKEELKLQGHAGVWHSLMEYI